MLVFCCWVLCGTQYAPVPASLLFTVEVSRMSLYFRYLWWWSQSSKFIHIHPRNCKLNPKASCTVAFSPYAPIHFTIWKLSSDRNSHQKSWGCRSRNESFTLFQNLEVFNVQLLFLWQHSHSPVLIVCKLMKDWMECVLLNIVPLLDSCDENICVTKLKSITLRISICNTRIITEFARYWKVVTKITSMRKLNPTVIGFPQVLLPLPTQSSSNNPSILTILQSKSVYLLPTLWQKRSLQVGLCTNLTCHLRLMETSGNVKLRWFVALICTIATIYQMYYQ